MPKAAGFRQRRPWTTSRPMPDNPRPRPVLAIAVIAVCLMEPAAAVAASFDPAAHRQEIAAWQQQRDQRLRDKQGWLTLAGLHWLQPGSQPIGSAKDAPVRLPP